MSTTTMIDSYDAQMLDYPGDMDVHMHTTVSSPKPWAQAEAVMEEDVHPLGLSISFPPQPLQQDVEVDMDDYYNEGVEYEMADGEDPSADSELLDIDVYDAPQAPSPVPVVVAPAVVVVDHAAIEETLEAPHVQSGNGATTTYTPVVSDLDHPSHSLPEADSLVPPPAIQVHEVMTPLQSGPGTLQGTTPELEVPPEARDSVDHVSTNIEESVGSPSGAVVDLVPVAIDGLSSSIPDNGHYPVAEPVAEGGGSSAAHHDPTVATHEVDASITEVQETHSVIQGHAEAPNDEVSQAHHVEVATNGVELGEAVPQPAGSYEINDEGEDTADPHEISEGVYIEPPPPILLELPSSSAQSECYLFNTPAAREPSQPETDALSATNTVLFSERPTLYYETLNEVFEALREEERIQRVVEFLEGEMIIDAYQLELAVAEDNIHAREVSLHDLNMLHDGLSLGGPLRLRLRVSLPRFIHRYRSLQHQLSQLAISRAPGHPSQEPGEQLHNNAGYEFQAGDYRADDGEAQAGPGPTSDDHPAMPAENEVNEQEGAGTEYYGYEDDQTDSAEHEQETNVADQYADAPEYPHASEEDEAYTHEETDETAIAASEPGPVLDSDAAHEGTVDHRESTEFEEHAEPHEEEETPSDAEGAIATAGPASLEEDAASYPGPGGEVLALSGSAAINGSAEVDELQELPVHDSEFPDAGDGYEVEDAADDPTECYNRCRQRRPLTVC
ncbi:hypothetical protein BC834DRAFT_232262 [Gloeopeniophorella convolvens]|nr:hypothetical protein BC834DRAFT_232262 [Gloeopeniophorella convolvens]